MPYHAGAADGRSPEQQSVEDGRAMEMLRFEDLAAWADGWDVERGGLVFTTDWRGETGNADRYHWVLAEAISAAAAHLVAFAKDDATEGRYRQLWGFADRYLIDHERGGWFHQLDPHNVITADPWFGKPDIYHALTACLLPAVGPLEPLLTRVVR